jgi:hypothetical protein
VKGKVFKRLRDNIWWAPIKFQDSGSQEAELHVNATPKIAKSEKPKNRVPSICRRICAMKVKGVVKLRGKSRKIIDLAKRGNFENWEIIGEEERVWIVHSSLRKTKFMGKKRCVLGALKESTLIDVSGFGG